MKKTIIINSWKKMDHVLCRRIELKMTAHFAQESTAHISPKWGAHLGRNI
jgi:hypothetical protein